MTMSCRTIPFLRRGLIALTLLTLGLVPCLAQGSGKRVRPPSYADCSSLPNPQAGELCWDSNADGDGDGTNEGQLKAFADTDGDGTMELTVATGAATGLSCTDCVTLSTETVGNYLSGATANGGLEITGTEGASVGLVTTCADQQLLKWQAGSSAWTCSADTGGGGSPGGSSGDVQVNVSGSFDAVPGFSANTTSGDVSANAFIGPLEGASTVTIDPDNDGDDTGSVSLQPVNNATWNRNEFAWKFPTGSAFTFHDRLDTKGGAILSLSPDPAASNTAQRVGLEFLDTESQILRFQSNVHHQVNGNEPLSLYIRGNIDTDVDGTIEYNGIYGVDVPNALMDWQMDLDWPVGTGMVSNAYLSWSFLAEDFETSGEYVTFSVDPDNSECRNTYGTTYPNQASAIGFLGKTGTSLTSCVGGIVETKKSATIEGPWEFTKTMEDFTTTSLYPFAVRSDGVSSGRSPLLIGKGGVLQLGYHSTDGSSAVRPDEGLIIPGNCPIRPVITPTTNNPGRLCDSDHDGTTNSYVAFFSPMDDSLGYNYGYSNLRTKFVVAVEHEEDPAGYGYTTTNNSFRGFLEIDGWNDLDGDNTQDANEVGKVANSIGPIINMLAGSDGGVWMDKVSIWSAECGVDDALAVDTDKDGSAEVFLIAGGVDADMDCTADAGGGGTPAGSDTQVQYNNAGAFGAQAGFAINKTSGLLRVDGGVDLNNDGTADVDNDGTADGYVSAPGGLLLKADDDADGTGVIGLDTTGDGTAENSFAHGMAACTTGQVLKASAAGVIDCGTDDTGSGGGATDPYASNVVHEDWTNWVDQIAVGTSDDASLMYADRMWYWRESTVAGEALTTTSTGHPSIIRLQNPASGGWQIRTPQPNFRLDDTDTFTVEGVMRLGFAGSDNSFTYFGTSNNSSATGLPTTGVYFRAVSTTASDGTWEGVCETSATETTVSTAITFNATWHHLKMTWDKTAGTVTFYIDGTSQGSCSTNIPSTTSMYPLMLKLVTTASEVKSLDVDAFTYTMGWSTAR